MEKKPFDLLTFGEIMLRLSPPRHARIVDGDINRSEPFQNLLHRFLHGGFASHIRRKAEEAVWKITFQWSQVFHSKVQHSYVVSVCQKLFCQIISDAFIGACNHDVYHFASPISRKNFFT